MQNTIAPSIGLEQVLSDIQSLISDCSPKQVEASSVENTYNKIVTLAEKKSLFLAKAKKASYHLFAIIKKLGNLNVRLLKKSIRHIAKHQTTATVRHCQSHTKSSSKTNTDPDSDSEPSHTVNSSYQFLITQSALLCNIQLISSLLTSLQKPHQALSATPRPEGHSTASAYEGINALSSSDRILRLPEVIKRTGISRSSIYCKIDPNSPYYDPLFPKKISLGPRSIGFLESEITTWIQSKHSFNLEK